MNFKLGDKVHPLRIIPVSNKQMMFKDENGIVINIIARENGHYLLVVKRNRDGKTFKANEYCWEHC